MPLTATLAESVIKLDQLTGRLIVTL